MSAGRTTSELSVDAKAKNTRVSPQEAVTKTSAKSVEMLRGGSGGKTGKTPGIYVCVCVYMAYIYIIYIIYIYMYIYISACGHSGQGAWYICI